MEGILTSKTFGEFLSSLGDKKQNYPCEGILTCHPSILGKIKIARHAHPFRKFLTFSKVEIDCSKN